ncbi:hypothetical protein BH23GEM6_BH23GEM6_00130 [soil metagenome]
MEIGCLPFILLGVNQVEPTWTDTQMRRFIPLAVLLLAACTDSTGSAFPVHGTYDLQTYDGRSLPADLGWTDATGYRNQWSLMSAEVTLHDDGGYAERYTYRGRLDDTHFTVTGNYKSHRNGREHLIVVSNGTRELHSCSVSRVGMSCERDGLNHTLGIR